ncbi:hypothetical protein GGS24DRAFT_462787 [Hypoxylon argillaceum]|nr:hypothetical protein GGS24DRAFT_462787 [Hypoxylon argillaceum]
MPKYCSSKAALWYKICYKQLRNAFYECTDCNKPTYFCPDCQDCHPPAHRLLCINKDLDISSPLADSQKNRPSIDSDREIKNKRAQNYFNNQIGNNSDSLSLGVPNPNNINLDNNNNYIDASCLDSGSEIEANKQTRKKKVYKKQQNNYASNITRSKHPKLAPAKARLIDLTLSVTPKSLMQLATLTKAIESATSRYIEGLKEPPQITQASVPPSAAPSLSASSKRPPGLQPGHQRLHRSGLKAQRMAGTIKTSKSRISSATDIILDGILQSGEFDIDVNATCRIWLPRNR